MTGWDVVVVGSGPNGLAAAVTLARAGLGVLVLEASSTPGGGARTQSLGLADGLTHDLCSAVHPLALASPFFQAFDLASRGVELVLPDVQYAHPLDGARAGIAYRDLERTAEGLGDDAGAWRSLLGPLASAPAEVVSLVLGDRRLGLAGVRLPVGGATRDAGSSVAAGPGAAASPDADRLATARVALHLGRTLVEQGSRLWGARFSGDVAPALLTGVAAHAITRLPSLAAAGTALLLGSLAHASGWPIPRGGSQAITDALLADLLAHGGQVRTGVTVRRGGRPGAAGTEAGTVHADLPPARAYVFDTSPRAALQILGDRMPPAAARALGRFRYGNAAAKVDYVLSGPVPWAHAEVGRAGTVHVGGSRADLARAEWEVSRGHHAARPVVLASDPTVVDAGRSSGGLRPLWTYAHVPAGSDVDPTEAVTAQIERFAPGFRDVVVASRSVTARGMAEHNANYVGGDIAAGAVTPWQMVARPTPWLAPYGTGVEGAYLCSASTPPGPGVHGLGGWYAARRVLRDRFGIHTLPPLAPTSPPPS